MKYPTGVKKELQKQINYGNRGMSLENDLNITNEQYRLDNKAIIYKKPTPITINQVDYKSRIDAVIKEAHFKIPSTTDYNGIYKGKYIDFEAKETKLDYFPLNNIHKHQIVHLQKIVEHGGIGFLIVKFTKYNKIFLLEEKELTNFLNNNTRKSIPLNYFETNGYPISEKWNPRIDYLKVLDQILKGEKCEKMDEYL
ncbi:MAG: Holliday junction resolvase RecU [Tenericutes bacterium]|nr:Holliday junction resolvase RecU [Mycoplasmatota bacterium]